MNYRYCRVDINTDREGIDCHIRHGNVPWTNYEGKVPANQPFSGWLYDCNNLKTAIQFDPIDLQAGSFWSTMTSIQAYRCPEDSGPYPAADIQTLTTYIINGSLNGITNWTPTLSPRNLYKITEFKGDTAVFWEIGSSPSMPSGSKNDGSNSPREAITVRHQKGTTVSFLDGHAEVYSLDRYMTEVNKTGGRDGSVLWRSPRALDGGHTSGSPKFILKLPPVATITNEVVYSE